MRLGKPGSTRKTERELVETARRESEANFRAFFRTMADIILVATPAR